MYHLEKALAGVLTVCHIYLYVYVYTDIVKSVNK